MVCGRLQEGRRRLRPGHAAHDQGEQQARVALRRGQDPDARRVRAEPRARGRRHEILHQPGQPDHDGSRHR